MKNEKIKIILKAIVFVICYLLIFKLTGILIATITNSTSVGVRLFHYILMLILVLSFVKITKKTYILKFDKKKFINTFKVGGIPLLLYLLFFISINDFNHTEYNSIFYFIGWLLVYLIGAGFIEELVVRGITIDILEKYYKPNSRKNILITCLISSILFGLGHIINYFTLGFIPIAQMINTIGLGLMLSAIYMRTRSIYGVSLFHGLWDIFISLEDMIFKTEEVENIVSSFSQQLLYGIVMILPQIIIFLFLLRKKKIKECLIENSKE